MLRERSFPGSQRKGLGQLAGQPANLLPVHPCASDPGLASLDGLLGPAVTRLAGLFVGSVAEMV